MRLKPRYDPSSVFLMNIALKGSKLFYSYSISLRRQNEERSVGAVAFSDLHFAWGLGLCQCVGFITLRLIFKYICQGLLHSTIAL